MATWILPFNPNYYRAVEAFDSLGRINWGQTTNITPKDIVYIYRTTTDQALLVRCRVNATDLPAATIDDSDFVLDKKGESQGNRFLELELLEKLQGPEYVLNELKKYGFAIYGGPIRMVDSLKAYIDKLSIINTDNKRFSVNDAVWIAAAVYAFFQYKKQDSFNVKNCFLKATELIRIVEEFTSDKVNSARISQWCNGDHEKPSHNYLRKVYSDNSPLFRVTGAGEFGNDDELPKDLDWEEKISFEGEGVLLKELKDFNENLLMFRMMLYMGGKATCAGLSERFGNKAGYYNALGRNFSNRVYHATLCELCKRDNGKDILYTIPFVGRSIMENGHDRFEWKIRDELKEALEEMNLLEVNNNLTPNKYLAYAKNMILYGPPGTGKTYSTAIYAVAICDGLSIDEVKNLSYEEVMKRFRELKEKERVAFTTFHQSYGYEEFIEGIKPSMLNEDDNDNGQELTYRIEPGVFKKFCEKAFISASSSTGVTQDYGFNKEPAIWKVSLCSTGDNPIRTECMENDHIRIGWEKYGKELADDTDYSECGGKRVLNAFFNRMKKGDIVFSCYSQSEIDAIGVVTGDPDWNDGFEDYKRFRNVKWLVKGIKHDIVDVNNGAVMKQGTIYRLYIPISDV